MSMAFTRKLLMTLCVVLCAGSSTAHPFAVSMPTTWSTEAAIEMLRRGGNATDAMVAASFVLNVTQPYNMGIGGGGFYLAWHKGKPYFWNSRETAPASAHEKMFLGENGRPINYYPERVSGPNPVGIPGMVAGLAEAHRKLGKLPWKTVLEPAIRLAREGFPITTVFAENLAGEWERIQGVATTRALFGNGEGGPLSRGRMLRQPGLSRTFEMIASDHGAGFYKGKLAEDWTREAARLGVKITKEDLASYKVATPKPIEFKLFGFKALTAPPPSAAGLMVAGSLRFLEQYYRLRERPAADSAARVIVTAETLRYFQELRNANIGDQGSALIDPQTFLGSPREREAWKEIEKRIETRRDRIETRVTDTGRAAAHERVALNSSHTAHLSVIDDHGNAVAYTTTIEQWFGSGITVPTYGFLLNNELSDFDAEPGRPNSPAPGKRPRSNMSPLLLFEGNIPVGVVGCAGGGRIPTVIVEMLENYFIHKMTLREAMAFPRFHPDGESLELDTAYSNGLAGKLKDAGYDVERVPVMGVPHALLRRSKTDSWEAAAEPRADGMALVLEKK